ncbi:RNA/RNP complex-1-interacting phosphatase [Sphaeramia orbicularis]|uniref:RNA/RNP complex-1-interacting phosphatase n=1 Tax=Sphaeramia orbicularis TaxID=375764 RepID=A0A673AUU2_9TELE|nr:RNA/RNP complex-1-interacting phosphatase-like [Sphaeramia orbicularis]
MPPFNKRNGIPDRWLDYKAVGKRLPGTRFIAFKVPLKYSLNCRLPCSDVFGPWELLDILNKENQELGLIIDLTFTTRYYKVQDVPESLLCVKIFTAGHEVPSDATILSFKRAVRRFLRDNSDNDKLIGVHCTHGLNRTGYLICRYLIDVDGMDPKEAVELFNSARGHAMERENYLEDLQSGPKRSNEGIEESEQEPVRGCAEQRPSYTESDLDSREKWQPYSHQSSNHRNSDPRGMDHRSHHRPPYDAPRHSRPLLPLPPPPPLRPPTSAPLPLYQWTPPHPGNEWRSPPHREDRGSRYPPPHLERGPLPPHTQEHWRRGPQPPAPHRHALPRHHAHWTDESYGSDGPGRWERPKMRPPHRYNLRVNPYDSYPG